MKKYVLGTLSAKTGVLLAAQNPGFCAACAAIERHSKRFRVLEGKTRLFLMARARIIFCAQPRKTGNPALHTAQPNRPRGWRPRSSASSGATPASSRCARAARSASRRSRGPSGAPRASPCRATQRARASATGVPGERSHARALSQHGRMARLHRRALRARPRRRAA